VCVVDIGWCILSCKDACVPCLPFWNRKKTSQW